MSHYSDTFHHLFLPVIATDVVVVESESHLLRLGFYCNLQLDICFCCLPAGVCLVAICVILEVACSTCNYAVLAINIAIYAEIYSFIAMFWLFFADVL